MTFDESKGIWWVASWRQIVSGISRERTSNVQLPLRLMRGVSPDLMYHLLAPQLARIEARGQKAEFSRIRDWATELVVGHSATPPTWPHEILENERIQIFIREFDACSVLLEEGEGEVWLDLMVSAECVGVAWREWSLLILEMFQNPRKNRQLTKNLTARMLLVESAVGQLAEAIRENQPSFASMALKKLGWTSPWSPEV